MSYFRQHDAGFSLRSLEFIRMPLHVSFILDVVTLDEVIFFLRFSPANQRFIIAPYSTWWEGLVLPMIPRAMTAGA
jgi:hypothetical protein